jgi:hypothetical protein
MSASTDTQVLNNYSNLQNTRLNNILEKSKWFTIYPYKKKRTSKITNGIMNQGFASMYYSNPMINPSNNIVNTTINPSAGLNTSNTNNSSQCNNVSSIQNDDLLYYSGDAPTKRWGHTSVNYNNKMIIYGGRHLYKSLSSMYAFDANTLTWSKIEQEGTQIPSSRDSHTALVFKDDLYVFGGNWQGKKLNDLWKFSFLDRK